MRTAEIRQIAEMTAEKVVEKIADESIELLTAAEVSAKTGIAERTLHNNRYLGVGIPFVKHGKMVRYRKADVAKYIREHTVKPCRDR